MVASSVGPLVLALMLQAIVAAPIISQTPGLETKDLGQEEQSTAKFYLAANTDVNVQVSSKGLICEFSCRAYGSHQEMWTLQIINGLDAPKGDEAAAERTASCTATSEHHDSNGHRNGMRGFHMKIYAENGVPELEVINAEAWNDGVNLLRGDEFEVLDTVLRSTPSWSRQVSSAKMVVASLGS